MSSSQERNKLSKVDGHISSASLRVDEPDVEAEQPEKQQQTVASNISSSSDIAAMKARARKSRGRNHITPGAVPMPNDSSEAAEPDLMADNSNDLSHSTLGQNNNQSMSSLSSTGAMKARARQSRIHHGGAPLTPGAVSVQEHATSHGNLETPIEGDSPSSLREKPVSASTGTMKARARQSRNHHGSAPLIPGAVSIANNDATPKETEDDNKILSYAPGEAPPNDESPATQSTKTANSQASDAALAAASNWLDPLAESSARHSSLGDHSSINRNNNHTDAYSQFAANPNYERHPDPRQEDEVPSERPGDNTDGTINAPVRHFSVWQSDSEAMAQKTNVTFDRRLCIIGAAVVIAIIIGVSVGVGLAVNGRRSGGNDGVEKNDLPPTPSPTPGAPVLAPSVITPSCVDGNDHTERFLQITAIIGYSEPGTARREAMCWLADLDELQLDPLQEARLQQRFALATFYFSTTSQTAQLGLRNTNWLNAQSECTWLGLECQNDIVLSLNLSRQFLTGALPPELSLLTQLLSLRLDENALSGQIPDELFELTTLVQWGTEGNQLNGTLSSRIAQLTQLEFVGFSRNQLSGTLPLELFDLKNLAGIFLTINRFSGLIPSNIGGMPQLSFFLVGDNLLTGTIPTELGLCNGLQDIAMSENPLNSTIPTEIGLLTKLAVFNIADAGIRGSIPSEMGNCRDLSAVYLQLNSVLVGGIPSELGKLSTLQTLGLELTGLTGSMPTEVCLLTNGNLTSLSSNCVRDIDCPCCDRCF